MQHRVYGYSKTEPVNYPYRATLNQEMNIQTGIISKWNEDKGFGFITPQPGGKEIFVHINDYSRIHKKPCNGLKVQYLLSADPKGRKCAVEVCPLRGHRNNDREIRQKLFSMLLFAGFACVLSLLVYLKLIPSVLVVLFGVMSVVTFALYAKDKNAAEIGGWRTSESTLHLLSLLGGWPGAAIAQSFLRHKSKKLSFRFIYLITVGANCGLLYWCITPEGSVWLTRMIRRSFF
jgi:uncharacterized membrane protein YsdA (DUF1294 family)/cold shock CspA family protein